MPWRYHNFCFTSPTRMVFWCTFYKRTIRLFELNCQNIQTNDNFTHKYLTKFVFILKIHLRKFGGLVGNFIPLLLLERWIFVFRSEAPLRTCLSFTRLLSNSISHSPPHSISHPLLHSLSHSLIHWLTVQLNQLLTNSFPPPLTLSLRGVTYCKIVWHILTF